MHDLLLFAGAVTMGYIFGSIIAWLFDFIVKRIRNKS